MGLFSRPSFSVSLFFSKVLDQEFSALGVVALRLAARPQPVAVLEFSGQFPLRATVADGVHAALTKYLHAAEYQDGVWVPQLHAVPSPLDPEDFKVKVQFALRLLASHALEQRGRPSCGPTL